MIAGRRLLRAKASVTGFILAALFMPAIAAAQPIGHAPTAAELRALVLYSADEFSTLTAGNAPSFAFANETVVSRDSLDHSREDPWFGFDKAQHLTFSFLWTLGTQYVVVNKGGFSEHRALPVSIGASAAVGLAKEYYDLRRGPPHVFSFRDVAANAVGILLATGLILLE